MSQVMEEGGMRIGELASRSGVSVRALRYYEEQGLLDAWRSPSGQRRYPDRAVARVRHIQELYALGLPSRTVVGLLPHVETGEATPGLVGLLRGERDRLDGRIASMADTRDRLDAAIAEVARAEESGRPCPRPDREDV
ncbi:MerR family transcriptional regulator [Nocardiopsis sp. NPDC101807]|uniref:MerR family transcriptional regulator n=1 Tax=Nocardiopsis sp. NPDC101807 TaxID=3364339 RepID=UPI0037FC7126